MIAPLQPGATDPRLILREEELDSGLELILLAEAALWAAVDAALEAETLGLGRSHWRAAFLLRRRPGIGVQDLSKLTSLSKQAASRTLADLTKAGLVERAGGDLDGRRKPTVLTAEGVAFEGGSPSGCARCWRGPIARAGWTAWPAPAASWRPWRGRDKAWVRRVEWWHDPEERRERHLLVVDDDDRIRKLLKEFLVRAGFRVTAAADAAGADRLCGSLDFDLMVLDVMMPGEDGFAFTKRLRAKGGDRQDPDPDADRPRPGRRPHRGPDPRRRRLSGQAVRAAGAAAAHRGHPAPHRRQAVGSAPAVAGPLRLRPRARRADLRRRPCA
jgi:DNA-binding transcriptional ArsR family regulator